MAEYRLFPEGTVPEYTTAEWYLTRERAPHLEQPGHRARLLVTFSQVRALLGVPGIDTVVDLGCGDGGLLSLIPDLGDFRCWGYDLSPEAVNAARGDRKVDARLLDVVNEEPEWADLAVATEMLEHLVDPHGFVRRVAEHCQAIVASSPAYETDRNHYEFHAWAWDKDGYRDLIEQGGFRVTRYELVGEFQVLSAVRTS